MARPFKNYYKILQVDHEAEPEVIDAAYRRLARKYHPDVNGAAGMTRRMQELNEAYMVLRDVARRTEYDLAFLAFMGALSAATPETPGVRPAAPRRHRPAPEAARERGTAGATARAAYNGYAGTPRAGEASRGIDWIIVGIIVVTSLLVCPPFLYLMVSTLNGR